MSLLFNKVDYFSTPSNPFFEEDKVKSGKQIGVIKLDDNKSLAIFEVEVDDSIRIDQNRKGLRDIAAKHIDQNITHGALVFFYSKNQTDYRFSFIAKWSDIALETGEFIKGETKPKRFTYLLGGHESCTTAAKRLLVLAEKKDSGEKIDLQKVKDTFAVEPLKKDFFKAYKEHYEKFWRYVANPEFGYRDILLDTTKEELAKQEKPIRDFAKKLLGRIVFLHFLQKKGWMGCSANTKKWEGGEKQFMQLLFNDFQNKKQFHSQCLTKLFFNTLNSRRNNDILEIKSLNGKLNGSRVPYLNGGLFEADKPKEILSVDFPVKYFEELFEFFAQYNFTIDENSPDDHEVGIDPEMLGHIFENLLEENREKGAFYTPKEVVEYMCKESTIQYLNNHFPVEANIGDFVRNHQVSEYFADRDNAITLNQKIDKVKVCDPAIGSGAFPIGMLHELFEAKKFIYPYLKTNQEFNPAKVKKEIIQNSIYGVDIEKGAVDIAQLRFWLALVVDETKPQPLPNLDYKIMQGNSLLESFEGIDLSETALFEEPKVAIVQQSMFEEPKQDYGFSEQNRANIKQLIKDYFKVEDKDKKTTIHKTIDKIVLEHIDKSLEFWENRLLIEIATYQEKLDNKLENLNEEQKKIYLTKSREVKEIEKRQKLLDNKGNAREKLKDFEQTDERPYFLWHLFFMDVFEQGGFDIMIGNPPYIKEYTYKAAFDGFRNSKYYQGKMDIWYGFACNGLDIAKQDTGILTFIATNNWTTNAGASFMREKVVRDSQILNLLDFKNFKIFEKAGIQTMIMIFKNVKSNDNYSFDCRSILNESPNINDVIDLLHKKKTKNNQIFDYQFERSVFADKQQLTFNPPEIEKILQFIKEKGKLYFNETEVGNGIHPHHDFVSKKMIKVLPENIKIGDGIFALSKDELKDLNLNEVEYELIKPYFSTKNFTKYYANPNNTEWLIYTGSGFKNPNNIIPYPNIKSHLDKFREVITSDNKPYGLHRARDEKFFRGEKIIVQRKCPSAPVFTYTDFDCYVSATFYVIKTTRVNQKYLTALLNSKLIAFWLRYKGKMQGNNYQIDKEPLVNIPILKTDTTSIFETLFDYILFLKNPLNSNLSEKVDNNHISLFFEDIIDGCVFELYFEQHIKEKGINISDMVTKQIKPIESKDEKKDGEIILNTWLKMRKSEIAERMRLFTVKSPDILKPIIQS